MPAQAHSSVCTVIVLAVGQIHEAAGRRCSDRFGEDLILVAKSSVHKPVVGRKGFYGQLSSGIDRCLRPSTSG
jgi:hypothetical protein